MDLGDRDARFMQQVLEGHLMSQREGINASTRSSRTHVALLAVTLDRGEPCRSPSGLLLDVQNPAQVRIEHILDDFSGELSHASPIGVS